MKTLLLTAVCLTALIVTAFSEECVDQNEYCKSWADAGHCEINPSYMKTFCKKSCKVCSGGPEEPGPGEPPETE